MHIINLEPVKRPLLFSIQICRISSIRWRMDIWTENQSVNFRRISAPNETLQNGHLTVSDVCWLWLRAHLVVDRCPLPPFVGQCLLLRSASIRRCHQQHQSHAHQRNRHTLSPACSAHWTRTPSRAQIYRDHRQCGVRARARARGTRETRPKQTKYRLSRFPAKNHVSVVVDCVG